MLDIFGDVDQSIYSLPKQELSIASLNTASDSFNQDIVRVGSILSCNQPVGNIFGTERQFFIWQLSKNWLLTLAEENSFDPALQDKRSLELSQERLVEDLNYLVMTAIVTGHCTENHHDITVLLVGDLNQRCVVIDHRLLQDFLDSLAISTFMSSFHWLQARLDDRVNLLGNRQTVSFMRVLI